MTETESLQAVLITDSFERAFRPITIEMPKSLIPVANIPMIEYVLEWLLSQRIVSEVFVIGTIHAHKIKGYLQKQWGQSMGSKAKGTPIRFVEFSDCKNLGDVMREIDRTRLIEDDFFLLRADVITNVNLGPALREHKKRRDDPKMHCILTKFLKSVPLNSGDRSARNELFTVIAPKENEILKYENSKKQKYDFKTPIPLVKGDNSLQARFDMADCHIHICTPEIVRHFADNFDFKSLDGKLIQNTLSSEILEDRFFYYSVPLSEYVGYVNNPKTYGAIAQGVIQSKVTPFVLNRVGQRHFQSNSMNFFEEEKIMKSKTASISSNCVIGSRTVIGDNSKVKKSCIGRNCKIGDNVVIQNSIIWNNVEIGSGSKISSTIICDGVQIAQNCNVPRGCVLSFSISLKEGVKLKENTNVSMVCYTDGQYSKIESTENESDMFERGSICALAKRDIIDSSERLGFKDNEEETKQKGSTTGWDRSCFDESDEEQDAARDNEKFLQEVKDTIALGYEQNHSVDNIKMEIQSLKFAYKKEYSDCIYGFLPFILHQIEHGEMKATDRVKKLKTVLNSWKSLIIDFLQEKIDFFTFIDATEDYCQASKVLKNCFHLIIQIFSIDITDKANPYIIEWYQNGLKNPDETKLMRKKFIQDISKFVEDYLMGEEEQDDEQEDEEEETEDDDQQS